MRMLALWDDDIEPFEAAVTRWNAGLLLAIFYGVCLASAALAGWGHSVSVSGSLQTRADAAFADLAEIGRGHIAAATADKQARTVLRPAETHRVAVPIGSSLSAKPQAAVYRQSAASSAAQPPSVLAVKNAHHAISAPVATATSAPLRNVQLKSGAGTTYAAVPASKQARYMVQVASVRNPRNAQTLTAQLRKMGFDAKIHPGRHDPYFHVQIGPFTDITRAKAMCRRVAARGYTAAVK